MDTLWKHCKLSPGCRGVENTAAARHRIKQRANAARALAGTCLSAGAWRWWTSASEGRPEVWGAATPSVRGRVVPASGTRRLAAMHSPQLEHRFFLVLLKPLVRNLAVPVASQVGVNVADHGLNARPAIVVGAGARAGRGSEVWCQQRRHGEACLRQGLRGALVAERFWRSRQSWRLRWRVRVVAFVERGWSVLGPRCRRLGVVVCARRRA